MTLTKIKLSNATKAEPLFEYINIESIYEVDVKSNHCLVYYGHGNTLTAHVDDPVIKALITAANNV